jgi:hypothetical protein
MKGKTLLLLTAERSESREDREGTGWGGGKQAEHCGKASMVSSGKRQKGNKMG